VIKKIFWKKTSYNYGVLDVNKHNLYGKIPQLSELIKHMSNISSSLCAERRIDRK